jgi:2-C-methyl-D-erythritol 2,4-cyclodiphosphate synthase
MYCSVCVHRRHLQKIQATTTRGGNGVIRIGLGQDSHVFEPEGTAKPLVLGGVVFPGQPGLKANSDGDVVLHAVFNALSSAVGKRSLGVYADPICQSGVTDSRAYLVVALDMVRQAGYTVNNVALSIEARRPRIEPMALAMQASIARLLGVGNDQVGITATTGEGLTAFGRGEGIQVFAIASLVKA